MLWIAQFGVFQKPPPQWQSARELQALLSCRDAITCDLQREKNRAGKINVITLPIVVRPSPNSSIAFLISELEKFDQAINLHIDRYPDLRNKYELLQTIPSICERMVSHFTALLVSHIFTHAELRRRFIID